MRKLLPAILASIIPLCAMSSENAPGSSSPSDGVSFTQRIEIFGDEEGCSQTVTLTVESKSVQASFPLSVKSIRNERASAWEGCGSLLHETSWSLENGLSSGFSTSAHVLDGKPAAPDAAPSKSYASLLSGVLSDMATVSHVLIPSVVAAAAVGTEPSGRLCLNRPSIVRTSGGNSVRIDHDGPWPGCSDKAQTASSVDPEDRTASVRIATAVIQACAAADWKAPEGPSDFRCEAR